MNPLRLTKRLEALAEMVRGCCAMTADPRRRTLADIGCDHARLPLSLLHDGTLSAAVASDLKEGPLARARENAERTGLTERVRFVCADGLKGLAPGEVRMAVISGMGGETIRDILDPDEVLRTGVTDFFLSPHTKTEVLKEYLRGEGYETAEERTVTDRGKRYLLLHVRREEAADRSKEHEMQ